jgi:predicted transcriptional regulator
MSDDFSSQLRGDHYGKWVPKSPLVFSMVYSDGGDTEWTFTLLVKDAQKALLLPKFIEAFNALAAAVREAGGYNEINIDGAGMHMALLNSPNGEYEWSPSSTDADRRFPNFRKSMQLLIPALYFLGASDGHTRSMNPRTPQIDKNDKYSAIYYQGGALEFRVFDTCYNRPEQILDNLVVMCNSLKYWSTEYKRNNLNKVTRQVRFGVDKSGDHSLARLYQTFEHIELLNNGLKLLKPSYLSISELKKQREFTVSKRTVKKVMSELYKNAEVQYQEYERRFGWDEVMRENNYIARELEALRNTTSAMPTATAIRKARKLAREKYHAEVNSKQTKEDYTKDYIEEKHTKTCGRWTLGEVN